MNTNTITRDNRVVRALPIIGGTDELLDMQERSDAFLSNRLRARSVRRSCPMKAGDQEFVLPVDFTI